MNKKPVAWISKFKLGGNYLVWEKEDEADESIPLYTSPQQEYQRPHNTVLVPCDKLKEMQVKLASSQYRELSDDEIMESWKLITTYSNGNDVVAFARTILEKAKK